MHIPYLVKSQNSRYYFRIIVPISIRSQVGRREIRRSLKTTDLRTAVDRCYRYADYYKKIFETMTIRDGIIFSDMVVTKTITPDGTKIERIELDPEKLEAEKELLREYKLTHSRESSHSSPRLLLSEVVERYVAEKVRLKHWKPSTAKETESAFQQVITYIGDRPIDTINRNDANKLLSILQGLPSPSGGKLAIKTINGKIGMLSTLFRYAIDNEYCSKNPFRGLQQKKQTKAEDERDIYTDNELERLFSPTHFIPLKRHPSRYWIPLLMLFTGARPGELAQLTRDDIINIDGVSCISINENHDVKTSNAIRTIPISKHLDQIGFHRFLADHKEGRLFPELNQERAKKAGAVSSWWNTTHHKHCNVKNKTKSTLGRVTKIRHVSLYSLRHGVQTIMRTSKIEETFCDEIVGHEKGGISYGRYAKSKQLKPLIEAINTLKYPHILNNLKHWPK